MTTCRTTSPTESMCRFPDLFFHRRVCVKTNRISSSLSGCSFVGPSPQVDSWLAPVRHAALTGYHVTRLHVICLEFCVSENVPFRAVCQLLRQTRTTRVTSFASQFYVSLPGNGSFCVFFRDKRPLRKISQHEITETKLRSPLPREKQVAVITDHSCGWRSDTIHS